MLALGFVGLTSMLRLCILKEIVVLCYPFGALKYIHALFGGTCLELLFVIVL